MGVIHAERMLRQQDTTRIEVVCEPATPAYDALSAVFVRENLTPPPNQPELSQLLRDYRSQLDAALIVTPHAYHYEQAKLCLEAGLDVLLEKPMVIRAQEAMDLIAVRDNTGKLLVIAFDGSLSPQVRTAARLLRSGEAGRILSITATIWEDWAHKYAGHWKQRPEISGGGFLFDCGAHMLNTIADLAGEAFVEVAAWLDNREKSVDVLGAVIAKLESGALVTMSACGGAIPSIGSEVRIFCTEATIRTGAWGERLEIQKHGEASLTPVNVPASLGVWEQFLAVRSGVIENPSPPEIGLRMAQLWDAIKLSSAQGGIPVHLNQVAAI
jgi:predicted dehydrogenase